MADNISTMAEAGQNMKSAVFKKKIGNVVYDLMFKTVTDVVYTMDNVTLTDELKALKASVDSKGDGDRLTALETKFANLVQDAPEAYDTLLEISQYISTHQDEYKALYAIASGKVDREEGKTLTSNDFTDAFMNKLDELYTKSQLDMKFTELTSSFDAQIEGVNNKIKSLEYSKVTVIDEDNIELELL